MSSSDDSCTRRSRAPADSRRLESLQGGVTSRLPSGDDYCGSIAVLSCEPAHRPTKRTALGRSTFAGPLSSSFSANSRYLSRVRKCARSRTGRRARHARVHGNRTHVHDGHGFRRGLGHRVGGRPVTEFARVVVRPAGRGFLVGEPPLASLGSVNDVGRGQVQRGTAFRVLRHGRRGPSSGRAASEHRFTLRASR